MGLISKIPSKEALNSLIEEAKYCLEYYDSGASLTFDHLENAIARILNIPSPYPELRGL